MRRRIIDGNIDREFVATRVRAMREERFDAVGVTVMGGPQVPTAIAVSKAIRAARPRRRSSGADTSRRSVPNRHCSRRTSTTSSAARARRRSTSCWMRSSRIDGGELAAIAGSPGAVMARSCTTRIGAFSPHGWRTMLPYDRLDNPAQYLSRTYLGGAPPGYQAAFGCRFRCTFCGVATMFRGKTALPPAARLEQDLAFLSDSSAWTRSSSTTTTSSTARSTWCRCSKCWRGSSCRGGVSRAPMRW